MHVLTAPEACLRGNPDIKGNDNYPKLVICLVLIFGLIAVQNGMTRKR